MTIPNGLTGWGAQPGAPFHGFEVFLDDAKDLERSSCMGLGVDLMDPLGEHPVLRSQPPPEPGEIWVRLGNRKAVQRTVVGSIHGIPLENVTVWLALPRKGYANSLQVTLVTPLSERRRNERIFRSFVSSLKFY